MPVLPSALHTDVSGSDASMEKKYDATYQLGKTTVHIVAPPPLSPEEKERILNDMHKAGWAIIDELVAKGELAAID